MGIKEKYIRRITRRLLNENFKVHEDFVWDMYEKLRKYEKVDCDMDGFDEFKDRLRGATDKLEDVLYGSDRHVRRRHI